MHRVSPVRSISLPKHDTRIRHLAPFARLAPALNIRVMEKAIPDWGHVISTCSTLYSSCPRISLQAKQPTEDPGEAA